MSKKLFALGMVVLAGCGAPELAAIDTPPVNPVYNSAGQALKPNELVKSEVRTFAQVEGRRTELVGTKCKISTKFYQIDVVTPAIANVPSFADKTPEATFQCTHNGKTQTQNKRPINLTELESTQGSEFAGLIGVVIAAAVADAVIKDSESVFGYSSFVMNMK